MLAMWVFRWAVFLFKILGSLPEGSTSFARLYLPIPLSLALIGRVPCFHQTVKGSGVWFQKRSSKATMSFHLLSFPSSRIALGRNPC